MNLSRAIIRGKQEYRDINEGNDPTILWVCPATYSLIERIGVSYTNSSGNLVYHRMTVSMDETLSHTSIGIIV